MNNNDMPAGGGMVDQNANTPTKINALEEE